MIVKALADAVDEAEKIRQWVNECEEALKKSEGVNAVDGFRRKN